MRIKAMPCFQFSMIMKYSLYISVVLMVLLCGCSVKRNNFFSRNYHQLTTRYNVYFNGNQALKSGEKNMEIRHKEDYTNLLPVFVSNNEQTRAQCSSDMDYATEKAVKAIDKHSITAKPRRRKNKDSKNYQTFRKKKEFNNQMDKCYLLLGKSYFYKKKYAMANNTFRFIQRQYAEEEDILTETAIWMFRSLTEMGRYDEAAKFMNQLDAAQLKRRQRELVAAARTDFYVRQGMYAQAIPEAEKLIDNCRSMKRKPRYNFMLSQLYLKVDQGGNAMNALRKTVRFNFNYEMVFNAKINMALAYQEEEATVEKKLKKMLNDARNKDYQDRIYYALGNIEERRGEEQKAIDLYWKSVRASVDNDNQQSLSFRKLGDYYFKERDYVQAQCCYDSCMYAMDSRNEDYDRLKVLLTDLTELTTHLRTIQLQDSLLQLAALPEADRNLIIDAKIEEIKEQEAAAKELERKQQAERNFFDRNDMINRGDAFSQSSSGSSDWYFYNPVTIALGKNEFKRKWGRRKLEDHWRRQNKAMVEFTDEQEELASDNEESKEEKDVKSRDYYLQNVPLTEDARQLAEKKMEDAYYGAGELYMYKFNDPQKALECFDAYIRRFTQNNNLPMVYYLAYSAAEKAGNHTEAARYKKELTDRFPDSDFTLGLQDPEYFRKVEDVLKTVEQLYAQAYSRYQQLYYNEAEQICDDILQKYPDNKLKPNVLFLKAMCVLNTRPPEGREALENVLNSSPSQEMRTIANNILAALSTGEQPVAYTVSDMAQARNLQATRNWKFDEEVIAGETHKEKTTYQYDKDNEQAVMIILPNDFTLAEEMRFKARMTFINASEAAEGKRYEMKKEDLWYKQEALAVRKFENAEIATEYLNRIATDKYLLKIIGNRTYRMFAIGVENLPVMKRLKDSDGYIDFFAENYFADRRQGEIIAGKWGAAAHVFNYEEAAAHNFVLAVPFREVNTKRIAEALHLVDPAFSMTKEDYDNEMELIVVKNVGAKEHAMDYLNAVLKDKEVFDRLAGLDYETFIITDQNLKAMQENEYLDEYIKFFNDNYLKSAGAIGVEDGDYVYNKSVAHKFILIYPNSIDPFKLKTVFEEFNFSGLTLNNQKFADEHDYMVISGFKDKEEAMRYFNTVLNNRKLFKSLKNSDYTNFIITDVNLQTLLEKKNVDDYLGFFKKYYLN